MLDGDNTASHFYDGRRDTGTEYVFGMVSGRENIPKSSCPHKIIEQIGIAGWHVRPSYVNRRKLVARASMCSGLVAAKIHGLCFHVEELYNNPRYQLLVANKWSSAGSNIFYVQFKMSTHNQNCLLHTTKKTTTQAIKSSFKRTTIQEQDLLIADLITWSKPISVNLARCVGRGDSFQSQNAFFVLRNADTQCSKEIILGITSVEMDNEDHEQLDVLRHTAMLAV